MLQEQSAERPTAAVRIFDNIFILNSPLILETKADTQCEHLGERIDISAAVRGLRVDAVRCELVLEGIDVVGVEVEPQSLDNILVRDLGHVERVADLDILQFYVVG